MVQERVHQRVLAMTCAGVNHQPGRFVYNDKIIILEQDFQRDVFGKDLGFLQRWFDDSDHVVCPNGFTWPRQFAV